MPGCQFGKRDNEAHPCFYRNDRKKSRNDIKMKRGTYKIGAPENRIIPNFPDEPRKANGLLLGEVLQVVALAQTPHSA